MGSGARAKVDELQPEKDESSQLGTYECLFDLYVLAHRFDCGPLRDRFMSLLFAEHFAQRDTLHRIALPVFQTVGKALESTPQPLSLRQWLVHIFAYFWRFDGGSLEQVSARDSLPKNFLPELALTTDRCAHFALDDANMFQWQWLHIDNDWT